MEQFCVKYYELQNDLHQAAHDAEVEGEVRDLFGPYRSAVKEIQEHLSWCGQCKEHLIWMARGDVRGKLGG